MKSSWQGNITNLVYVHYYSKLSFMVSKATTCGPVSCRPTTTGNSQRSFWRGWTSGRWPDTSRDSSKCSRWQWFFWSFRPVLSSIWLRWSSLITPRTTPQEATSNVLKHAPLFTSRSPLALKKIRFLATLQAIIGSLTPGTTSYLPRSLKTLSRARMRPKQWDLWHWDRRSWFQDQVILRIKKCLAGNRRREELKKERMGRSSSSLSGQMQFWKVRRQGLMWLINLSIASMPLDGALCTLRVTSDIQVHWYWKQSIAEP